MVMNLVQLDMLKTEPHGMAIYDLSTNNLLNVLREEIVLQLQEH